MSSCPYKEPSSNIRKGMTGEAVKWLQWMLNANNIKPILEIDGEFGAKTDKALRHFQTNYNLEVDGICGKDSKSYLKKYATTISDKYTVKIGDSWWGIASSQMGSGLKMNELAKANGRTILSFLKPGEVLTIPNGTTGTIVVPTASPNVSSKAKMMVDFAYGQLGALYVYGSQGQSVNDKLIEWSHRCFPQYTTDIRMNRMKQYIRDNPILNGKPVKAFDCSGLVLEALAYAGLEYPDTTAEGIYYNYAYPITKSELREGDIVLSAKLDHIGIVGRNGETIEAAGSDTGVVKSDGIDNRYLKSIYGSKYGTNDYNWGSTWAKFARLKDL